jgi:hypothetical protein
LRDPSRKNEPYARDPLTLIKRIQKPRSDYSRYSFKPLCLSGYPRASGDRHASRPHNLKDHCSVLLSLPPDSKSVERRSSPDLNLSAGRAQQRPNPPPPAMTTLAKLLAQKRSLSRGCSRKTPVPKSAMRLSAYSRRSKRPWTCSMRLDRADFEPTSSACSI